MKILFKIKNTYTAKPRVEVSEIEGYTWDGNDRRSFWGSVEYYNTYGKKTCVSSVGTWSSSMDKVKQHLPLYYKII